MKWSCSCGSLRAGAVPLLLHLQGEDFSFRASFVVTSSSCAGDVRWELVLGALGSWDVFQVRAASPSFLPGISRLPEPSPAPAFSTVGSPC